jgi:hypothetical protein
MQTSHPDTARNIPWKMIRGNLQIFHELRDLPEAQIRNRHFDRRLLTPPKLICETT